MTSPALERHSYYLEAIVSAQTLADLSSIRTEYTVDTVLNDGQKWILKSRYEIREMQLKALFTAPPGKAAPAYSQDNPNPVSIVTPQQRVAASHAQDDAVTFGAPLPSATEFVTPAVANEVFPEIEIVTTNSTANDTPLTTTSQVVKTSSDSTPTPSIPVTENLQPTSWLIWSTEQKQEDIPKKRTRSSSKDRDEGTGGVWTKGTMQVTLSREVKLPIDGVQFSNNLFGITLTASTYEEAKALIEEAFADFTESTKLISKAHVDKAYAQWLEDGKKSVPAPVAPVLKPATKVTYTTNEERARAMINQMANSSPAALEFAKAFTALNPMLPTNNLV